MKFKERIKSYKFWVALSASVVVLVKTLGDAFGFDISGEIVNSIIMAFCGVLIVFGVVEKPIETKENIQTDKIEQIKENSQKNKSEQDK